MNDNPLEKWKEEKPEKFMPADEYFSKIRPGDRIFIATGCGEPQYLVHSMVEHIENHPKSFFDAEVLQVWTLGVAPYAEDKFQFNFRHHSFFVSDNTREAVNEGRADYTPVFLSDIPELFNRGQVPVDASLIQVSPPDNFGYMSLGISVDIVKSAVQNSSLVIAQVNHHMPRVWGDSFIHIDQTDALIPYDESLLEFNFLALDEEKAEKIGKYVSRIVEDGDTLQVGYGAAPDALLYELQHKKDLGIHTELLTHGAVELMKSGAVTNSNKSLDRGKTVASFCMGSKETYDYLHNNPAVEFKPIDYTNNPLIISQQHRMVAINSALQIDLTGQATAESLGDKIYSGIGGQTNFMRGAVLAPQGKTVLALPSTSRDESVSRIIPQLGEGAGATLTRGDLRFVVTEYGIAYLHGKNLRERALSLVSIAHPKFRPWLIEEAKKLSLIYQDQAFIPGEKGEYPDHLEAYRTTKKGLELFFRPVKISDEPLIKDFFYSLSDKSIYQRFLTLRRHIPREEIQNKYVVIDYTREMILLAIRYYLGIEVVVGLAQYYIDPSTLSAEISVVVRDDFQSKGVGLELLNYLVYVARKQGLKAFTADILPDNTSIFRLLEKSDLDYEKKFEEGLFHVKISL